MPSKKNKQKGATYGMTSSGKDIEKKTTPEITPSTVSVPVSSVPVVVVPAAITITSPSPPTVVIEADSPWRDIPDVVVATRQDSIPPMTPPRSPLAEKEDSGVINPMAVAAAAIITENSKIDSTPQIVNSLVHPELGIAETSSITVISSPTTVKEPPSTPILKPVVSSSYTTPHCEASMAGGGPGPASPSVSSALKIPPPPLSPLRNGRGGVVVAPPASPTRKASSLQTVKKTSTDVGCDCCPTSYKKLGLPDQPPPPPPPPPSHVTSVPAAANPTLRPSWMT